MLGDVKGLLEVVGGIGPRQLVELYQVRSRVNKKSISLHYNTRFVLQDSVVV